jgi:hypothetical protein
VLGNPRRRRRYDLERAPQKAFVSRSDGTMAADALSAQADDEIDSTTRLIRGLPWMLLVVVLFAIFVFTAYATTGGRASDPNPNLPNAGSCVVVADGPAATPAACGSPGARVVVTLVSTNQQCPFGSERLQPATGTRVYCLEV